MADEMLLSGQFAKPARLGRTGFEFNFQDITRAISDALKPRQHE